MRKMHIKIAKIAIITALVGMASGSQMLVAYCQGSTGTIPGSMTPNTTTGPGNTVTTPDAATVLGYHYGVVYNISAATSQNAESNIFSTTGFNSLFGFGVEYRNRWSYGLIFNITDRARVTDAEGFGRKLLLPTQKGFVFNAYRQQFVDGVDPYNYNDDDHVQTRFGWYTYGGVTPVELSLTNSLTNTNKSYDGWIGYFTGGFQMVSQHFNTEKGSLGFQLRVGPTVRTLISGLGEDEFWSAVSSDAHKRRTYLGLELQLSTDIQSFRPTVQFNYFPTKDKIPGFSGSVISIVFDIGNSVSFTQSRSAPVTRIASYVSQKIESLGKRQAYLSDDDSNFLIGLVYDISPYYNKQDMFFLINELNNLKARTEPVPDITLSLDTTAIRKEVDELKVSKKQKDRRLASRLTQRLDKLNDSDQVKRLSKINSILADLKNVDCNVTVPLKPNQNISDIIKEATSATPTVK